MCVPRIDEFGNIDWVSWECILHLWEWIFGMGWEFGHWALEIFYFYRPLGVGIE